MISEGKLLFLGTGGSMGIPMIGCRCPVCISPSPHNKRLRPSAMVQIDQQKIVIDPGPDYRTQALYSHLDEISGVVFTHAHHDHAAGIDDLRAYFLRNRKPLPCLLSFETAKELSSRYPYIFVKESKTLVSRLELHHLPHERGKIDFLGLQVGYMTYVHSGMAVNGLRFGNLAYVTDIKQYPETIFEDLEGVEVLVVSALRHESNLLHFSVEEAVAFANKAGAKEVWLTHLTHDLDHEPTNARLPPHVQLAYDGLIIKFKMEFVP